MTLYNGQWLGVWSIVRYNRRDPLTPATMEMCFRCRNVESPWRLDSVAFGSWIKTKQCRRPKLEMEGLIMVI